MHPYDLRLRRAPCGLSNPHTSHLLAALLLAACFGKALGISCSGFAVSQTLEEDWLQLTSVQGGRPLPSIINGLLGSSDWPEDQDGVPQQVTDKLQFLKHGCQPRLIARYKWYHGTLWTDQPVDQPLGYRQQMVEMLLISKWLYKDLPDMDIMFNSADQAAKCGAAVPMLQNTVLNPVSTVTGKIFDINLSHLVYPHTGKESSTIPRTRGYTIPYKDAWRDWSLSPKQMEAYSKCVQQKIREPALTAPAALPDAKRRLWAVNTQDPWAAARKPQLVWRGSTTGFFKGWHKGTSTKLSTYSNPLTQAFWNKRLYMCAMARPYPWLDLGITHIYEEWVMAKQVPQDVKTVMGYLKPLVMKPTIDVESQSAYQLVLSIDGNGAPWRLPRQMLGLTPIVKVDSPYQEFFAKHIKEGVHFESVKYDLSDLASTAKRLIDEAAINSTRLQHMAAAAQEVAVGHLNALGQLDAFVWSLLKLKAAYGWTLEDPGSEPEVGWRPVLVRPNEWSSHGLRHIKQHVQRAFPHNFLAQGSASSFEA